MVSWHWCVITDHPHSVHSHQSILSRVHLRTRVISCLNSRNSSLTLKSRKSSITKTASSKRGLIRRVRLEVFPSSSTLTDTLLCSDFVKTAKPLQIQHIKSLLEGLGSSEAETRFTNARHLLCIAQGNRTETFGRVSVQPLTALINSRYLPVFDLARTSFALDSRQCRLVEASRSTHRYMGSRQGDMSAMGRCQHDSRSRSPVDATFQRRLLGPRTPRSTR